MQILKAGRLYFALVFEAGFLLGSIRTLWAVPTFGTSTAELMETPFILVATSSRPVGQFDVTACLQHLPNELA
jgi:hypothetical protein